MAQDELTGLTENEVSSLRSEFDASPAAEWYDFDERYCLFQIPFQPDDYDGPPRFCSKTADGKKNGYRCRFHNNRGWPNLDNLDKLAALKHGMHATDEHLLSELEDDEKALYQDVLSWAETYHIDPEADPSAWDDLKMLAVERVRTYRTSKWMLAEGETRQKPVFDSEGNVADMEDAPNALSEEHRRLKSMIMSLKRDLGLTRKEKMKQDGFESMSDSAESLSAVMGELVHNASREYDPEAFDFDPDEADADADADADRQADG